MAEAREHGMVRVLVMHPDTAARRQIARVLAEDGFEVLEAKNIMALPRMLAVGAVELLVLAPAVSSQDTVPLLATLRDHPARLGMAILALDPRPGSAVIEAGADDVLPLTPLAGALCLRAHALIRLKRAERAGRALAARLARTQDALRRAAERFVACVTLDEALTAAVEIARRDLGFDRVAIALYDPLSGALQPRLASDERGQPGHPREYAPIDLAPGGLLRTLPVFQALFDLGLPSYHLPDTGDPAPPYYRPLLDGPMGEALFVTLPSAAGPLGILAADTLSSARRLGLEDARVLEALAGQLATVVERARLTATLAVRAHTAEALAEARGDIVMAVRHELRAPLAAICGFTEILRTYWSAADEQTRLDWVGKIAAAAARQRRLVEDLLLMARLEGGALDAQRGRVSLATLAQSAAEEVRDSHGAARIDLVGDTRLEVHVEWGSALRVVANVLDHALMHSPEGSAVVIWWEADEEMATLRVVDSGPGMYTWGRHDQYGQEAESGRHDGLAGAGAGLYLSRGLAMALGGDLDLEATGPHGSTLRLRLPLAPSTGAAASRSEVGSDAVRMEHDASKCL